MSQKTALLSVYRKKGIVEFAQELSGLGFNLIASGGTCRVLKEAGLSVTNVAELSGRGPILGHRVVTLTAEIQGGLQATEEQREELANLGFPWIDLVCVDLYPLKEETRKKEATRESVIEKTDIGGPTMIRAGAKGRRIVIADPADRSRVISWIKDGKKDEENFINELVAKAEGIVADYCLESARYHSGGKIDGMIGRQVAKCKYGENPQQKDADLFTTDTDDPLAIDQFELIGGILPSFVNYTDYDRLLQTLTHISETFRVNRGKVPYIAVAVKHGNPCGASFGDDSILVLKRMIGGDTQAIFGGIIATNFHIGKKEAEVLKWYKVQKVRGDKQRRLLDGIMAPSFSSQTIEIFERLHGACRFMKNPALNRRVKLDTADLFRPVRGGFLKQPNYTFILNLKCPVVSLFGRLTRAQEDNILLAKAISDTSNSNTVALVKGRMLIGLGNGQMDRVGAADLAIRNARKAGHKTEGSIASTDSFFPFPDGAKKLIKAGIKVIQGISGSIRDDLVKSTIREKRVILTWLSVKVGRGFYRH